MTRSCTFNVREGIGTEMEGYGKNDVLTSCNCIGAEKVKGKGYFLDTKIKELDKIGKGIAVVCGSIAIGVGTVALCIAVPEAAEIILPIGGGTAIAVLKEGLNAIKESGGTSYGRLKNKLPSCIKKSWEGTKSVNLDWNGLYDISELEGLQDLEEVSARFNNLNALPDLNKIPKLKSMDLTFSHLPPFTCGGKEHWKTRKMRKEEIEEIRKCQSEGTFKYRDDA